jgi:hypothetical protein
MLLLFFANWPTYGIESLGIQVSAVNPASHEKLVNPQATID